MLDSTKWYFSKNYSLKQFRAYEIAYFGVSDKGKSGLSWFPPKKFYNIDHRNKILQEKFHYTKRQTKTIILKCWLQNVLVF